MSRSRLIGIALAGALAAVTIAGCASGAPSPAATPIASPGHAEIRVGEFLLVFDMPRTSWTTADNITGTAELRYLGTGATRIGTSGGGPFVFDVRETNGDRHVEGLMTADCVTTPLAPGAPLTSGLIKGGAFDTSFARAFLTDKLYRLPAGDWDITAVTMFNDGASCSGTSQQLRATIRIDVKP